MLRVTTGNQHDGRRPHPSRCGRRSRIATNTVRRRYWGLRVWCLMSRTGCRCVDDRFRCSMLDPNWTPKSVVSELVELCRGRVGPVFGRPVRSTTGLHRIILVRRAGEMGGTLWAGQDSERWRRDSARWQCRWCWRSPARDRCQQIPVFALAVLSGTHLHASTGLDGSTGRRSGTAGGMGTTVGATVTTKVKTTNPSESQPSPGSVPAPSHRSGLAPATAPVHGAPGRTLPAYGARKLWRRAASLRRRVAIYLPRRATPEIGACPPSGTVTTTPWPTPSTATTKRS